MLSPGRAAERLHLAGKPPGGQCSVVVFAAICSRLGFGCLAFGVTRVIRPCLARLVCEWLVSICCAVSASFHTECSAVVVY